MGTVQDGKKTVILLAWPKAQLRGHRAYNSATLSRLLTKRTRRARVPKVPAMIKKVSPAAWRYIHLNAHYTFRSSGQVIDLDAIWQG